MLILLSSFLQGKQLHTLPHFPEAERVQGNYTFTHQVATRGVLLEIHMIPNTNILLGKVRYYLRSFMPLLIIDNLI